MADLSEIRVALAAAVTRAVGDVQCNGYVLASPSPPFVDIELADEATDYDQSMGRGLDLWRFVVRCVVAQGLDIGAQRTLDVWCASSGEKSVKAAIEADLTLGGVVETLQVTRLAGFRSLTIRSAPNNVYLGAEWTVEVYVSGE